MRICKDCVSPYSRYNFGDSMLRFIEKLKSHINCGSKTKYMLIFSVLLNLKRETSIQDSPYTFECFSSLENKKSVPVYRIVHIL